MSVYASGLMAKAKRECQKNFKLYGVYETNFQRYKKIKKINQTHNEPKNLDNIFDGK